MPIRRLGVILSPLKASIVDMVQRGGEDGATVDRIFHTLFSTRNCTRATLHAHVWQINEKLEGHRIVGVRDHNSHHSFDRYKLVTLAVRGVA